MGLGPINTTLLLWLTIVGAEAESHHAIFHHQGEVVLGNDFCHLLIDLDLNNVTQEIAELVHATETASDETDPRDQLARLQPQQRPHPWPSAGDSNRCQRV